MDLHAHGPSPERQDGCAACDALGPYCLHPDFACEVDVNRLFDSDDNSGMPDRFAADVRVACLACGERFEWVDLPMGLHPLHTTVSADGLELRANLRPERERNGPHRMSPGFWVRASS